MKKRIFSVFLAVVIMTGLLPLITPPASAAGAITTANQIQIGDYFQIRNLLWRCVSQNENGALMLRESSNEYAKSFSDNNSNVWADSKIRAYLNGTFYDTFNAAEKTAINNVEGDNVTILTKSQYEAIQDLSVFKDNSADYYKMFESFWTKTPGSSGTVYITWAPGSLGHATPWYEATGVGNMNGICAAFYLKTSAGISSNGDGSNANPYTLAFQPDAPVMSGVTADESSATVYWTAPNDNGATIDSYEVFMSTSQYGVYESKGSEAGLSKIVTGLTQGTEYWFKVKSHNSAGWSDYSAAVKAVTKTIITATLSPAENLVYNGSAKSCTISSISATLVFVTDYKIRYTGTSYNSFTAPSKAGSYTATFELSNWGLTKYIITNPPSLDFTVAKADPSSVTLSATPANSQTYPGTVKLTATVTGAATPTGTVTFKNGTAVLGTGTLSSGIATYDWSPNAGSYNNLTAVYEGDSNFSSKTSDAISYTVAKADPASVTLSAAPANSQTYPGTVKLTATVVGAVTFTGTVTFKNDSAILGTGTLSSGIATYDWSPNAGTYNNLTAVYEGDSNFSSKTSDAISFTVNNANQNAPTVGKTDETFAGKNDGKITGVTSDMEYKSSEGEYKPITGTTVTELAPGTYTVRYKAKTNYNEGAEAPVTINAGIPVALESISVKTPPNKTAYTAFELFDASGMVLTLTNNDGSTSTVTSGYTVDKTSPLVVANTAVNITYGGKTISQTITVSKLKIEKPAAMGSYTYNGTEQTVSIGQNDGYSISQNTGENAGSYAATVTLIDTANCAWSDGTITPLSIGWSIGAKALDASMISDIDNQPYTGSSITPAIIVTDGSPSIIGASDYDMAYSSNTNAGEATVILTGKGNYSGTANKTFTIMPKVIQFTVDNIANVTYNKIAQTPVVIVKDGTTELKTIDDYTVAYSNNINAGTGTATITGVGNFMGSSTSKTFVINKAELTVTAEAKTKVQNTVDPELTYSLSGLIDGDMVQIGLARKAGEEAGAYQIMLKPFADNNYIPVYISNYLTITGAGTPVPTAPTGSASGTVTDNSGDGAPITVTIEAGNKIIASVALTSPGGNFSFTSLPNGIYNIVADNGSYKITKIVEIVNGQAVPNILMEIGKTQSIVEVKTEDTPDIAVGGLNEWFDTSDYTNDNKAVVAGGGTVEIKLTTEKKEETSIADNANKIKIVASGKTIGIYIDLTVAKTVIDGSGSVTTTMAALTNRIRIVIPIPEEIKGKSGIVIYRVHNGVSEALTQDSTKEEYYTIDGNYITLYVKKFSTYAIAYTTPTSGGSGGHKSSSVVTPATNTETSKDLPYYMKGADKIFIGFASEVGGKMKYTAPEGTVVLFGENSKNFTDNTIAWAKPSIDFVTEREIFLGTTQDQFGPNESMTRAMFVTAIGRLYERSYGDISGTSTFSDVNANDYFAKYVAWANENGIIKGIGENKFAPKEKVTREQMAVIMLNFATYLKKGESTDGSLTYGDSASISAWAINGAKYCQETKVITGRDGGSFAPQESATRAEVAIVIERFIKTIVK